MPTTTADTAARPCSSPPRRRCSTPSSPPQDSTDRADDTERARWPASCRLLDGATTAWLHDARDALIRSENADPDDHPATTTRERDRRFPSRRLAAWVTARDQTCIAPGLHPPRRGLRPRPHPGLAPRRPHRSRRPRRCSAATTTAPNTKAAGPTTNPPPAVFVITDPTGTRHHTESRVAHPRPAP